MGLRTLGGVALVLTGLLVAVATSWSGGLFTRPRTLVAVSQPPHWIGDTMGEPHSATIGASGGRITVPADDQQLPSVTMSVPSGAVPSEVRFSLQAESNGPFQSAEGLANAEPNLFAAIVGDATRTLAPHSFNPVVTAFAAFDGARFAGPALRLEPEGLTFRQPVTIVMPLALVGEGDRKALRPLTRDAAGHWEVVRDFAVDAAAGTATVRLSHFSRLSWWFTGIVGWYAGLAADGLGVQGVPQGDPLGVQSKILVENELDQLPDMQSTYFQFLESASCANVALAKDPDRTIPPLSLLWYLATHVDGAYASGFEDQLKAWLVSRDREIPNPRSTRVAWRKPNELTLADVFGRALVLSNGDVWPSLLATHNVLRADREAHTFDPVLESYRGDLRADPRTGAVTRVDETGARYHLFGTATFSYAYEYWRAHPLRWAQGLGLPLEPELVVNAEERGLRPGSLSDEQRQRKKEGTLTLREEWGTYMWGGLRSGDILTDPRETAVDLQGIDLGERIYSQLKVVARPATCEKIEIAGPSLAPGRVIEVEAGKSVDLTALVTKGIGNYGFRWAAQRETPTGARAVDLSAKDGRTPYLGVATLATAEPGTYTVTAELMDVGQQRGKALATASLRVVVSVVPPAQPRPAASPSAPPPPCPQSQQPGLGGLQDAIRCQPIAPQFSPGDRYRYPPGFIYQTTASPLPR